mmetsp:Transcript_19160/g.52599  ORF Transcript_19160/g.52599 Transcript_19160/m.52599 type:complete len:244 (-) Transcript_19160:447-1178(-)
MTPQQQQQLLLQQQQQQQPPTFGLDDWLRSMMSGGGGGTQQQHRRPRRPLKEVTRTLSCTLADLYEGKTKTVTLTIGNNNNGLGRQQKRRQEQYTIHVKPGWKAGTKIKFPQRGRYVPPITFVVEEAPHATLERRDADLIYRHKVVGSSSDGDVDDTTSGNPRDQKRRGRRKKNPTKEPPQRQSPPKPVRLSIALPDGTVWQRTIPADRVPRIVKAGQSLTVPDLGMPMKGTLERGNLVIEFY